MIRGWTTCLACLWLSVAGAADLAAQQPPPPPPRPVVMPSVIEGRIKLSDTSDMKGSAVVQLYRDNDYIREVLSDASGYFSFPNLYPGRYRVIVKMTGYQEVEERVDIIGAGNISRRVMIQLRPLHKPEATADSPTVSIAELGIPKEAAKSYQKGKDKLRKGKIAEAIREFQEALAAYPQFPQAINDLGLCYRRTGDTAEAERQFNRCLGIDPKNMPARLNLADLYASSGRLPQALALIEEAVLLHPAEGEPRLALGQLQLELGRLEEAERACRKAVELRVANADVHLLLAKIYLQKQQLDLVAEELEAYLRKEPKGKYAPQVREQLDKIKKTRS